jgi:multiple antibiotic resistance protein
LLLWDTFLLAFSALLPLINPFGTSLIFLGLVGDEPPEVYRSLARRVAVNNIIFLAIIEGLGSAILNFFGISLPIVQLSGGIIIGSIAWSMLNGSGQNSTTTDKETEAKAAGARRDERAIEQMAFYPITFPITSGPGTLVAMLTLSAHVSEHTLGDKILGHAGIFIAVLVLSALVYLCYGYAPRLAKAISPSTAQGILRVVAFILFCIGIQIAWNGLSVLLHSLMQSAH